MSEPYSRDYDALFPDKRTEPGSNIRTGQLVMLRLLKIFHKACQDLGFCYWLCGGTLIGAIRHEGFIPWDDDVDVFMPREQYDEFIRRAPEVLPYDVWLQTDSPWIRLVDRFGSKELGAGSDFIFIDIFPTRRFPTGRKLLRKVRMLVPPYPLPGIPGAAPLSKKARRIIIRLGAILLRGTGLAYLVRLGCSIGSRRYWSYDLEVTWRFYYRDDWVFPLRLHVFEDASFFVPNEWHKVLTHQFGDYMTPPAEGGRVQHSFKSFKVVEPTSHPAALAWEEWAEHKAEACKGTILDREGLH